MAVTPESIAVALGRPAPSSDSLDWQQWEMWISDAEMLIESRADELGKPLPDEVKFDYVVREAVVAQVKKPDDATQVTVQIDDGMTSKSYQSGKGRVTILDDWWKLLGLTDDDSKAFAVDMLARRSFSGHLDWCNLAFGASWCSCGADIAGRPIFEGGES